MEVITGDDDGGSPAQSKAEADAPIIKLVTKILVEAYQSRSSDIHIEPLEKSLRVRYRIDGVMQEIDNHPKHLHGPIIARLKIMTGTMSIDERRVPQDGRIQARSRPDKDIDLRVSTVPTNHGECVVMRILDKIRPDPRPAPTSGSSATTRRPSRNCSACPTGSSSSPDRPARARRPRSTPASTRSTSPDRKIITVEDPVEYQLSGINQVMVKEDIGMTFAAALRSMLRQAPNIIMIGEIRDLETANIAINASLTGHLVFSTLHTNDAPERGGPSDRHRGQAVSHRLRGARDHGPAAGAQLCKECKTPGELD